MQVELLRDHITWAKENPDEETKIGFFWCYAPDYDKSYAVFKKFIMDEKLEEIKSEECNIKRYNEEFLVNDSYGNHDLFTKEDVLIFLDLWEKAQKITPNVIYDYPGHDTYIEGTSLSPKLRTIFEDGIKLDVMWFYDTKKNIVMWVLSESFFYLSPEKQDLMIKKLKHAAAVYCERCNKLQRPFGEFGEYEPTPINPNTGFSEFGCLHFSPEQLEELNEALQNDQINRAAKD